MKNKLISIAWIAILLLVVLIPPAAADPGGPPYIVKAGEDVVKIFIRGDNWNVVYHFIRNGWCMDAGMAWGNGARAVSDAERSLYPGATHYVTLYKMGGASAMALAAQLGLSLFTAWTGAYVSVNAAPSFQYYQGQPGLQIDPSADECARIRYEYENAPWWKKWTLDYQKYLRCRPS